MTAGDVFVHESSYVDDGAELGPGTKVWHFSHVLPNTRIGADCTLGQNVVVGPDVTVGDRCRVEPISPSKKKNRGRVCTIVGFRKFGASIEMASVIWEDTQEYGGADMSDLVVIPLCEIEAR